MAIPKEKSVAVQLIVSFAASVGFVFLFRAAQYLLTGDPAFTWLGGISGLAFAAIFYWWYGYMQRSGYAEDNG
jgi:hypothetical protein